ncbi:MAG: response regulator transcription factor [Hydrogenothermaceae bacterium]|nr:response regulator transcription factor [Hydrogenothermaceae bacterium]
MKILIVEDNVDLNNNLKEILELERHIVDSAFDGREALDLIERLNYDIVILDIMLPYIDGYSVAKLMREKGIETPIIMLTALGELESKLRGFEIGADDYIVKPFEIPELIARVNAIGKRVDMKKIPPIEIGDVIVDISKRVVKTKDGKEIDITQKLFCILEQLLRNRGKIVTQEVLAAKCWEKGQQPSGENMRAHIKLLRKLIGDKDKTIIKTISGVGYRIDKED